MSKQFDVKKLYKVTIKIPVVNSLDDYYNLKNIYDESIQKNTKRKCINCRKVNMTSLVFSIKNRNLVSICPTPDCKSNMIIPIETCSMYNDFFQESKEVYEYTVDRILGTKYKILFGYKSEKDTDIVTLKEKYKTRHELYIQNISDYKEITYPKTAELTHLEQRRDDLIEQLKIPDTDVQKIYKDLRPILCNIRKLKYTYEIPESTNIVQKPYSIVDLLSCSPPAPTIELTDAERKQMLANEVQKPWGKEKVVKPKLKSKPVKSTVDKVDQSKDAKKND